MFIDFFLKLRSAGLPVSLMEYLTLVEATATGVAGFKVERFYYLSRSACVKDERHLDRFDRVFGEIFKGLEAEQDEDGIDIVALPDEWLRKLAERHLTPEEMAQIEALGGSTS